MNMENVTILGQIEIEELEYENGKFLREDSQKTSKFFNPSFLNLGFLLMKGLGPRVKIEET